MPPHARRRPQPAAVPARLRQMQLGKLISGYCDPEVNEDTLEAALAAVLGAPRHVQRHHLRASLQSLVLGTTGQVHWRAARLELQQRRDQWMVHDESGDSSNCYTPLSPPPHFYEECNTHKGFSCRGT